MTGVDPVGHVSLRTATIEDAAPLALLFDAYRRFYEQPSDLAGARRFLEDRIGRGESHVIVATLTSAPRALVGFVQLYPGFSSVRMVRALLLNDLWVEPVARRRGVARALIRAAHAYAESVGVRALSLSTATTNHSAQTLYESEGYVRESGFEHYDVTLAQPARNR